VTPDQLAAIRERCEAALEGPWMVDADNPQIVMAPDNPPSTFDGFLIARIISPDAAQVDADADFIAHARDDVPALLAEVERLRAVVDAVRRDIPRLVAAQVECCGTCVGGVIGDIKRTLGEPS
jgi:hypothetical protein